MFPLKYGEIYKDPTNSSVPACLDIDVDYPNLNSLDYSMRPINNTHRMHEAWQSISLNANNHIALATNKISGREWYGTMWGFEDINKPLTKENACFGAQFQSMISQIQFTTQNILLVALHCGSLQLWSTYSDVRNAINPYSLFLINERREHLKPIAAMQLMKANNNLAATGCKNGTLKIWDMSAADLTSTNTFRFAHCDVITALDTSYNDEAILATCSLDKTALIFDYRLSIPASALIEQHYVRLTHIAWAPAAADNLLYVADEIGYVHNIDKRVPNKLISSNQYFDDVPIRKVLPKGDKLAVTADSCTVKISSAAQHKILYENADSTKFIRDCVWWKPNKLLTVGLESKMRVHCI